MNLKKEKKNNKEDKKGFLNIFKQQLFHSISKSKDDLTSLIKNSKKKSSINKNTRNMLGRVIQTTKKRIKEIMVPKIHMITIKSTNNLFQCLKTIEKYCYSKFPIINKKNKIQGFITIKNLIPFISNKKKNFSIKKILQPIIIIPESKYIDTTLSELSSKKNNIAIIIDEFGTVSGLITIKDIIKFIVGKTAYKSNDINKKNITKVQKKKFIVEGLTKILDFNKYFKTDLKDLEIDTIGGLVLNYFGKLPNLGEKINIKNCSFEIIETNNIRIKKMKVIILKNIS
ncbi:transporter associated domain-containing protein [Buchnera aphidicola (Chaitoregma tattakana)]|uniref:transporter associated domain-containing protein n=1 Tax=Buchnera aphidicola TaxID=9 RepID=UPI0031B83AD3